MKSKEKKQLGEKTAGELRIDLRKAQDALGVLLLDKVAGKLKNTSSLTNTRKEIAVIQTMMNRKELV